MENLILLSILSGVVVHQLFYRYGEWDLHSPMLVLSHLVLIFTALVLDLLTVDIAAWLSILFGLYTVGVLTSMLVYRAFFHRLRSFPGPWAGRLSNFYMVYRSTKQFKLHKDIKQLHERYGDFVRTGPNQLSVAHPKGIRAIYAANSRTSKGPGYAVLEPRISLSAIRDRSIYPARRRVWDKAFNASALRNYESRIEKYAKQLHKVFARSQGSPFEVNRWFTYFAFDVMSDFCFGKSFGMLVDGRDAYLLQTIQEDRAAVGLLGLVPWTFPIFQKTPVLNAEYLKMWKWIRDQVSEREKVRGCLYHLNRAYRDGCTADVLVKTELVEPDVFSWLLEDYQKHPKTKQARLDLEGDAYLLIVAGSDTTATTLVNIFFYLATDSGVVSMLRTELATVGEDMSFTALAGCSYLNAVVNETLRLHPVILSGLQRETPPEGLIIGQTFIPGSVLLQAPQYVLGRDERCFVKASEFLPERWTTLPELIEDSSSFAPFSIGTHSCVGKQLAMMELRWVVASTILNYDVKLASEQTTSAFLEGEKDFFNSIPGQLSLSFTPRN